MYQLLISCSVLLLLAACDGSADPPAMRGADASTGPDTSDAAVSGRGGQASSGVVEPVGNVTCVCDGGGSCKIKYSGKTISVEQSKDSNVVVHGVVIFADGRCTERDDVNNEYRVRCVRSRSES